MCLIGGYFGGPGQIKRLEVAWKSTLSNFGFPMKEFHAKDLVKSRKARPMLEELARVAGSQRKVYPVAYGIVVDDFNTFSVEERRFLTGATLMNSSGRLVTSGCPSKPYFVPFQHTIKIVTNDAPVGGKAHFHFGLGRPFSDYARSMFAQIREQSNLPRAASHWTSRDRLGEPSFPLSEETAPLQAADLLVHAVYLHMREQVAKGESADFTRPASGLARLCVANAKSQSHLVFQNKEHLQHSIDDAKILSPAWAERLNRLS